MHIYSKSCTLHLSSHAKSTRTKAHSHTVTQPHKRVLWFRYQGCEAESFREKTIRQILSERFIHFARLCFSSPKFKPNPNKRRQALVRQQGTLTKLLEFFLRTFHINTNREVTCKSRKNPVMLKVLHCSFNVSLLQLVTACQYSPEGTLH